MILLVYSCSNLIYHGTKKLILTPAQFGFDYEEKIIPVTPEINLKAWLIKSKDPKRLLVQFHGNSENRSGHFLQFAWLTRYNTDILIFDYRGFADSSGISGDRELKQDSIAVLNFIENKLSHYQETILAGQSIGGYYLLEALKNQKRHYKLLILDSTFASITSLAQKKISSRLNWFKNTEKIKLSVDRTLIIHGKKDPVIPFELSEEINEIIDGEKISWFPEEGKHLDTFFSHKMVYRERLLSLLGVNEYKNRIHSYSEKELALLQKKYCNEIDSEEFNQKVADEFINSIQSIQAPAECEESCLCNFYADIFKRLGSRRLAQSMYRQNSLSDELRESFCKQKIQKLCLEK
jgi:hypothetical protein